MISQVIRIEYLIISGIHLDQTPNPPKQDYRKCMKRVGRILVLAMFCAD